MSFIEDKLQFEGLTFDDVLLLPAYSEVLPRDVDLSSGFTRNIPINTPIIPAAMDNVAKADLAIAIANNAAHGHTKSVIGTLREAKRRFSGIDVVAVNIGTTEAARRLINEGADSMNVGTGSGQFQIMQGHGLH
jgi:IMP dehydrogenase/GMP reductase